jgi:hypothetical protein
VAPHLFRTMDAVRGHQERRWPADEQQRLKIGQRLKNFPQNLKISHRKEVNYMELQLELEPLEERIAPGALIDADLEVNVIRVDHNNVAILAQNFSQD